MKKKSLIVLLLAPFFTITTAFAQNEIDALRYAQTDNNATALSLGLAGAGGAMGGDFSMLSVNPAGIGVYRSSELTITPSLQLNKSTSTYLNATNRVNSSKVSLRNVGMVFTKSASGKNYDAAAWKSFSVGIGYNRIADFKQNIFYKGYNDKSSIAEMFAASAQANGVGLNVSPPWGFLGYEGYLIDDQYQSIVPYWDGIYQKKDARMNGNIGGYTLTLGGNYKERLLLGFGFGINSYHYNHNSVFSEDDATGNLNNDFEFLDYYEKLATQGLGVNARLGAIFVANDYIKLGAAFHSPTWAYFSDVSEYALESNTENYKGSIDGNPGVYVEPSESYSFNYGQRSPWRAVASASAMLGRYGMVNVDYEAIGFNSMKYTMRDYAEYAQDINTAIKNTYNLGHVVRIGAEGRFDKIMARAGFAYHTSPFKDASTFGGERMDFSLGLGARFGAFFIDAGYMHSRIKQVEYAYPALVSGVPVGLADMNFAKDIVALTIGFKM